MQYLRDKTGVKAMVFGKRRDDRHEQLLTHSDVRAHKWPALMGKKLVID